MIETKMLAAIAEQAQTHGADLATLQALIEDASELGATRALARLGLSDEKAHKDLVELRDLLAAWRDAKSSARKALVDWLVRGALVLLLIGIAVKLNVGGLIK